MSSKSSFWKIAWPQVFQGSPKTDQRKENSSNGEIEKPSLRKSEESGDAVLSEGTEASSEPAQRAELSKESSSSQVHAVNGRAEHEGGKNGNKGTKASLSIHSQVTCLSKEAMDKIARERMMTIVRGMLAAQNIQGDNVPIEVEPGLFVGSAGAARNKPELYDKKITHILTVAHGLSPSYPANFKYKIIEVMDSPEVDLLSLFSQCFDFIEEARRRKGGVLVHCFAGRSRSVTVVVAYLMKKNGMTVTEALDKVRRVRGEACPNFGFMFQLRDFEKKLMADGVIKKTE